MKLLHRRIQMHQLAQNKALHYFQYTPTVVTANTQVLVAVHGISRNAQKQARLFAEQAELYNVLIIAPLFDQNHYSGYQRLGLSGQRADLALNQILDEVASKTNVNTQKFSLFGYSGGGQFVHRYALAYPQRVKAMAIGAAGWYTLPNPKKRYPYGIAPHPKLPDLRFNMAQFLQIPAYVLVGEEDTLRDDALRKSKKADQQGINRFERGQHWIRAMQHAAQQHGLNTPYQFIALPNSNHSFTRSIKIGGMAIHVFLALFGHQTDKKIPSTLQKNAPNIVSYADLNLALTTQFL